jgi:hypothetical protein
MLVTLLLDMMLRPINQVNQFRPAPQTAGQANRAEGGHHFEAFSVAHGARSETGCQTVALEETAGAIGKWQRIRVFPTLRSESRFYKLDGNQMETTLDVSGAKQTHKSKINISGDELTITDEKNGVARKYKRTN